MIIVIQKNILMQWKKYGKNAQHYKITKNDKKVLDAQIEKMKYEDTKRFM